MGAIDITHIAENYRKIQKRIQDAAARSKRDPESIRLVAVTKTVSVDSIREAFHSGIRHIGENRFQDALPKLDSLKDLDLIWHFIGHIQTNKAKRIAEEFHWIHSVDRVEVAEKLDRSATKPLSVFIEVKLHEEPNKSGVSEADLPRLIAAVRGCRQLKLQGLMSVPPFLDNPEEVRPYFRRLRELGLSFDLHELSMGMTHDFEIAIEEGATWIRLGTGLFGSRT